MRLDGKISQHAVELDEAVYLARPVEWKSDKRRVYNYRRILFRARESEERISATELVENILKMAFGLSLNISSGSRWIEYLDSISELQVHADMIFVSY